MLPADVKLERMRLLCSQDTPAIIISRDLEVPEELIQASNEKHVPVFKTHMTTTKFSSRLTNYLEGRLAQ